jgi:hypothetical protein
LTGFDAPAMPALCRARRETRDRTTRKEDGMDRQYARKVAALRGTALVLAIAFLAAASPAPAQDSSAARLGDILAKGARPLSAEEVNALVPGAKVRSIGAGGAVRTWTNESGGKLIAQSDDPTQRHLGAKHPQGPGTWRVDDGKYCVSIEWPLRSEQWCRLLFRLGDKHYAVKSADDPQAVALEFDFRR